MEYEIITAVGIDVSKGKSMVAVRRPGGEVVLAPFQVKHDAAGLSSLVKTLRDVGGEIRIVMEHTGMYWRPIALALKEAGFFVSSWRQHTLCHTAKEIQWTFQVGGFCSPLLAQGLCGGHFPCCFFGCLPQMVRQSRVSFFTV